MSELQPYSPPQGTGSHDALSVRMAELQHLPMRLVLEIEIAAFTVGTLLALEPGAVLTTTAQQNEDLLLQVNGQPVGPVKFDVTGDNLAVRLTGIA